MEVKLVNSLQQAHTKTGMIRNNTACTARQFGQSDDDGGTGGLLSNSEDLHKHSKIPSLQQTPKQTQKLESSNQVL